MNILSVTEHDEICCPICETRHKMSEYEIVYTKTIDGRIMKTLICPICKVQRGFIVEKEGE
jgi:uncharacterized protein YbaR (Trm112 family)